MKTFIILIFSFMATIAQAQITHIEISERGPAFLDKSFGDGVTYEQISGRAYGEVDPEHLRNTIITDLPFAPLNANGKVDYTTDFVLLKPVDVQQANGILRYLAPNRGRRISPTDSVFLAEGTTFLWGAWQGDVIPAENKLMLDVPIASNPDGSAITGPVSVELVGWAGQHLAEMPLQGNTYNSGQLPYPPATLNNAGAMLTRRIREGDTRVFIPNDQWAFATCNTTDNPFPGTPDPTKVCLQGGFEENYIYELIYKARDPKVMGIGPAAIRDLVSFFRHEESDRAGNQNPLAGVIEYAMGAGISQAGNFIKTFIHLGFNEDLQGRRVFDAVFPLVAARQTNINMRFAIPGGGGGVRLDRRAFGQSSVRGFAPDYHDELRGTTGGIFNRCTSTNTCPKTFLGLSGSELWVLQGSPGLTNALGTEDLAQPENLRIYYFAGTQHGTSAIQWNPAITVYPAGVESTFDEIVRALWVRLQEWVEDEKMPPPSQIPQVADGTLIHPKDLQYPSMQGLSYNTPDGLQRIPDFEYLGWYNGLGLLDFGPRFREPDESGIADWRPPAYMGRDYAILVSAVDADGNEVAGIQPVGNAVPLGTNLPFNYSANLETGDLFWLSGSFIPFHKTRQERIAAGDERLSLEERYGNHEHYLEAVQHAVDKLVADGFLLEVDAVRLKVEAAKRKIFD